MTEDTVQAEQLTYKVLVVDDEVEISQMISLCLQKGNFQVICAENVADACRLLVVEPVDVIISDVMMPGEDGIVFLGRVHESWPDIPVILMTGHAQLQMAVNAIKNGAFDFVHKPFDFEHLRKIVMRAINYRNLKRMEANYRIELEDTVAKRTADLKEAMIELDFARTSLQQAATDKSTFMSTVTHEMRTPMNGVIGSLDLLAEEGLEGAASEYLAFARQSADNMLKLINQLLSFSDLSVHGSGINFRDLLDFKSFLHALVVEQQPAFTRKKITLSLQMTDDLPAQIWTDKEKLLRLCQILLGNALKFSEHGNVDLKVSRLSDNDDVEQILFTVTDSGIGIPEGMLERIFEPFVQGDGSLTRRHEGVGLGLVIARQIAALLNGRLWAEHIPEGGSRFKFAMKILTP